MQIDLYNTWIVSTIFPHFNHININQTNIHFSVISLFEHQLVVLVFIMHNNCLLS